MTATRQEMPEDTNKMERTWRCLVAVLSSSYLPIRPWPWPRPMARLGMTDRSGFVVLGVIAVISFIGRIRRPGRADVGRRRIWCVATMGVLTAALYERFSSRGEAEFQNKLLSAMRYEFGGHLEKPGGKQSADKARAL